MERLFGALRGASHRPGVLRESDMVVISADFSPLDSKRNIPFEFVVSKEMTSKV